jgi:hypothetical protein
MRTKGAKNHTEGKGVTVWTTLDQRTFCLVQFEATLKKMSVTAYIRKVLAEHVSLQKTCNP